LAIASSQAIFMIRELKSLKQLRLLVLAKLEKHDDLRTLCPEISTLRVPDKNGNNWVISQGQGADNQAMPTSSKMVAPLSKLQLRYKAHRRQQCAAGKTHLTGFME
jgi:hypothetical protein